ncbi:hypothetical protein BGZ58_001332 [Dissophora ornata]|nr:hypothetical protein BGZ58_001332 [Dissophora ornata]
MSALSSIVNSTSPKGKQASLPPPATASNGTANSANATATTATSTTTTTTAVTAQTGQSAENNKGAVAALTTADDVKYKRKYKDLKKRIRDIEEGMQWMFYTDIKLD